MKKSMLTALIALGFITPIITNTGAQAAEFNQNEPNASAIIPKLNQQQPKLPKLSEKQLKIQDSDIETWMPNSTVRKLMLEMLIAHDYLPEDSTVNDITKDLLGSVRAYDVFSFEINAFRDGQITSDVGKGLQYINPKAIVTMSLADANETQLMQVDYAQLHQSVDQWGVFIINPDKIANPQLIQKVKDLPIKTADPTRLPEIYYLRANYAATDTSVAGVPTKTIDISENLFPSINLTEDDFWKENDRSLFTRHTMLSYLITTDNFKVVPDFHNFTEVSEGNFVGTLPETEANVRAMKDVANDPQNYYTLFRYRNIYDDGQHQEVHLISSIYADFHK